MTLILTFPLPLKDGRPPMDVEHSGNNADDSPAARADDNFERVVGILFRDKTEIYIGTEMQVRIRAEP